MSTILYGLAIVPAAAMILLLVYDRFFSPRGIKLRAAEREKEDRLAQARLDLLNKAQRPD